MGSRRVSPAASVADGLQLVGMAEKLIFQLEIKRLEIEAANEARKLEAEERREARRLELES